VVDLTQTFEDAGNKILTYDIIANESFISWEGTVQVARLYTHPFVKSILENFLLPFKEYLGYVGNVSSVSLDNPNVFEWMVLKRFQELFVTAQNPKDVLPLFFDTAVFGSLCELSFSSKIRHIPKITKKGKRPADLDSETARPDDWHTLMSQVDKLPNICLKPRSKSASSDALLIAGANSKKGRVTVTVGLAVKNFGKTTFTNIQLQKECDLFNRMFEGTDCEKRINVLFICCTNYHQDIVPQFAKGKLFQVYNCDTFKYINEVVLLNLTSAQNRASFFHAGSLSICVENIVGKSEVEMDNKIIA
jgi:hypothetical protein